MKILKNKRVKMVLGIALAMFATSFVYASDDSEGMVNINNNTADTLRATVVKNGTIDIPAHSEAQIKLRGGGSTLDSVASITDYTTGAAICQVSVNFNDNTLVKDYGAGSAYAVIGDSDFAYRTNPVYWAVVNHGNDTIKITQQSSNHTCAIIGAFVSGQLKSTTTSGDDVDFSVFPTIMVN